MAKFFPLDLGETASSRNSYTPSEGLLNKAEGFYPRPSRGLAPRNASEYKHTIVSNGLYCGGEYSSIRNISISVFFQDGNYTFYIFDDKQYDVLIKTLTIAGPPPRLPLKGGTITLFELSRNSINAMTNNPFIGPSIILVAGLGLNLKYLDDDLVLKDFRIQTTRGIVNTPVCEDVTAGQQRLVLYLQKSVDKFKEINGLNVDTDLLANTAFAFSTAGFFDNFVTSATSASSSFESILSELGPSEEIYNIVGIKKQVVITTSEGLWIIRSIAEETKPLSYDNQFPYKVDHVPAVPCKAIQFDNNFILYAATNGIIRTRQYNSLTDLNFPTADPGGTNMPVIHEEFRGIKKIATIGNPYIMMVLDVNGNVFALGTSILIKAATILFPRTSILIGQGVIDIGAPSFWHTIQSGSSYITYRDNKEHKMHKGLQYNIFPELTVLTQGENITINVPHLSRMLIKINGSWIQFRYNGAGFSANVTIPNINGQTLPYVPLLTSPSYVIPFPRWKTGLSSYQVTISGVEYIVGSNAFDIRFDGDTASEVTSLFVEEMGRGTITVESDTLPGLDSIIKEVGLMWSYIADITYSPLPKEDLKNIPDPERTLYRNSFDAEFSPTKNTMSINILFELSSRNDEYLSIARIYTV